MNKSKSQDKMYKGSSHTFFFNIKKAKNNNNYLQIIESRFDKKANKFKRNSIFLFAEDLTGFSSVLSEVKLA